MHWNPFFPLRRVKKPARDRDAFDDLTDRIESFAPRKRLADREAYYYNYKALPAYRKPLQAFLETAAQVRVFKADEVRHARELFVRLKAFYDVQDRLSMQEALKDQALLRKFRELFPLFYDREKISPEEVKAWLKDMV